MSPPSWSHEPQMYHFSLASGAQAVVREDCVRGIWTWSAFGPLEWRCDGRFTYRPLLGSGSAIQLAHAKRAARAALREAKKEAEGD